MKPSCTAGAWCARLVLTAPLLSFTAQAALLGRLPETPGGNDYQAYYDTALDITWIADANLAANQTFGASGVAADGRMDWNTAGNWIAAMNNAAYLGFSDWRLPSVGPLDGSGDPANMSNVFTTNASTPVGYAPTTTDGSDGGWRDPNGNPVSEMGHMYYVNLANRGYCPPEGSDGNPQTCDDAPQPDWGLLNSGPFAGLVAGGYWTGVEYTMDTTRAWSFGFSDGGQGTTDKAALLRVWAVRDGDVVVPLPASAWLFFGGLAGLVGLGRSGKRVRLERWQRE
ncbi:VPLPA-CTERM sorting domain-containing protein [Thiohalobacter sp.]|uniref:VPLPA-CTERM sorting domain-containing protein n=1 Tax=Thiohalobacter sp. TaxID=2025948 RepID=UPI0026387568|nr:DUF1566 domain-containing protein [Thiohalobacter sp.]